MNRKKLYITNIYTGKKGNTHNKHIDRHANNTQTIHIIRHRIYRDNTHNIYKHIIHIIHLGFNLICIDIDIEINIDIHIDG